YIERDISLIHISKMNIDFTLEIYGEGWDVYPELSIYYKGMLEYGKDISKVYNEAEYSLVLGGYVMQQRTLESAASGCIPIVIDSRYNKISEDEECFDKSLLFMKKIDDLPLILRQYHNTDLKCIVDKNNYESFVNKIYSIVKREI
ncbi:glycosyltransferase family protein, partial [Poseidonibacter sp.]|uniref:glycosyltransferase family protein n=1 Tax=Poseidonibacter sp. TaxID=2321188 RepID=UPI003C764FA6